MKKRIAGALLVLFVLLASGAFFWTTAADCCNDQEKPCCCEPIDVKWSGLMFWSKTRSKNIHLQGKKG